MLNGAEAKKIGSIIREKICDSKLRIFETEVKYLTFSLSLGLHYARGQYIARMDSDDLALPTRLRCQIDYLLQHPDIGVLGTDFGWINNSGEVITEVRQIRGNKKIRKALLYTNPICHPSVMFRKDIVEKIGGYLGYIYAEDYDLWCRLSVDQLVIFENLPSVQTHYRVNGIGHARGSLFSYSGVLATQCCSFSSGHGIKWLMAAIITSCKILFFLLRRLILK